MEDSSFLNPSQVIAAAGIHEGMRIADFGSGSGFFTRAAGRAVGPTGVVWAIDIHRELLARVKNLSLAEGLKNIEVMQGDLSLVEGSHLPEDTFDVVIATNVLFQLEEKEALFTEIARVLKRGSSALVVDWTDSHGGLGPHPDHVITENKARALSKKSGLMVTHNVPAGAYHWGFIARKKAAVAGE